MSNGEDFFGQIEQEPWGAARPELTLSTLIRTQEDAETVFLKVAQLVEQCVGGVSHIDRGVADTMYLDKIEGLEVEEDLTLDQRVEYLKSCWAFGWNTLDAWGERDELEKLSRAGTWGFLSSLEEYIRRLCVRYSDDKAGRKPDRDLAVALTLFKAFRKSWPGRREAIVLPLSADELPVREN